MATKYLSEVYLDDGCWDNGVRVSERCTECPLKMCKYDDPKYLHEWRLGSKIAGSPVKRDSNILYMRYGEKQALLTQYAKDKGVSLRTVYRWLAKDRRIDV